MTAWVRRVALVVVRYLRRRLAPPGPPPGTVRHDFGAEPGTVFVRGITEDERAEMLASDPRPGRPPRRWVDRRAPRMRW